MGIIKITNGKLITPYRVLDGEVLIKDGFIEEVSPKIGEGNFDEIIDAKGGYISPGFIDIHSHGGGGYDFLDKEEHVFDTIAKTHSRHGTTMIFPTLTSSRFDVLKKSIQKFEKREAKGDGARTPGLHLEGPYFAMEQKGAQDPRYVRNPDKNEYMEILDMSKRIARWSLAPELPGALEFGRILTKRGIVAAIGHSNATYEQVLAAYENGFNLVTHLYSCCSMVRRIDAYRVAGVVESSFLIDGMNVEIIADGHHLPVSLLKLILKNKDISRIALVTDSIRAAGENATHTVVGDRETGLKAIVEGGVAKLPDRTAFAGSVATADKLVQTMVNKAGVRLVEAIEMMTATPAKIMGVYEKAGSLTPGKYGDLAIFDENLNIKMTMVGGKIVFKEKN